MKTYTPDDALTPRAGDEGGREWVFDALAWPATRERTEQLSHLRAAAAPGLRAVSAIARHGQVDGRDAAPSRLVRFLRAAAIALGPGVRAAAPRRRRALWLALAAGAVILVPLAGSHLIDDSHTRGGVADAVKQPPVKPVPRSRSGDASGSTRGAAAEGVNASAGGKASGAGAEGSSGSKSSSGSESASGSKSSSGSESASGSKSSSGSESASGSKSSSGSESASGSKSSSGSESASGSKALEWL